MKGAELELPESECDSTPLSSLGVGNSTNSIYRHFISLINDSNEPVQYFDVGLFWKKLATSPQRMKGVFVPISCNDFLERQGAFEWSLQLEERDLQSPGARSCRPEEQSRFEVS